MWRKIQAIVGSFCVILYAAVVIWAGFSIIKTGNGQKALAKKEFDELTGFANSAGVLGFFSQNFKDDIESFFRTSKTMQALIVTGPDGRNITLEKIDGAIRWTGDYPRFSENIFFFQKPYFTPLRIEGLRNAGLSVLASRIDYDSLIGILRTALFAVILASIAAFGILIAGFAGVFRGKGAGDTTAYDGLYGARREKKRPVDKRRAGSRGGKTEVWEKSTGSPTEVFLVKKVGERPAGDFEDDSFYDDFDDTDSIDSLDDFAEKDTEKTPERSVAIKEYPLNDGISEENAVEEAMLEAESESIAEEAAAGEDATASAAGEATPDGDVESAAGEAAPDGDVVESAAGKATPDGDAAESAAGKDVPDEAGEENLDIDEVLFDQTSTDDVPEALSEEDFIEEARIEDEELTDDLPDFEELAEEINEITDPLDIGGVTEDEAEDFAAGSVEEEAAPDMPVYEDFGDEVDPENGKEQKGLLAAAARVYEQDVFNDDESEEFMAALSEMIASADENNEDLCLVDAEWIEAENNAGILRDVAEDFFKVEAKIFERGPAGVHIIIPDATLDEAFLQVKEFYGRAARENAEDDLLVIGLSAKSGRKIDPHLLVKETRTAIEKGVEDDTLPIVAFKVDLEKYNHLYASQHV